LFAASFRTTNSGRGAGTGGGRSELVPLLGPLHADPVFRSALCFWEEDARIAVEAGPWAIAEYLEYPQGSRFIQSFKTVAASPSFEHATIFGRRYRFEDLGRLLVARMTERSGGALKGEAARVVVGRPVAFAGHRPDEELARRRYDGVFAELGAEVHYVYEPMGAAFSFAAGLAEPATVLVADFGGGTSDFFAGASKRPARCDVRSRSAMSGVRGIAADRSKLPDPRQARPGRCWARAESYRSFEPRAGEIPAAFRRFRDWSRLAFIARFSKTLAELERLFASRARPAADRTR
jgi:hypothetical chaperone protein